MALFRMYWLRVARRPGVILLWMALPFAFLVIYQLAFGGGDSGVGLPKTPLGVVDHDSTLVSRFFAGALTQGPLADLVETRAVADTTDLEPLFARDEIAAALVIPRGFARRFLLGEADTLTLLTNPRMSITPRIARGILETMAVLANGLTRTFAEPMARVRTFYERGEGPGADETAELSRAFYAAGERARGLAAFGRAKVVVTEGPKKESPTQGFNLAALFLPGLLAFSIASAALSLENRFLIDRLDGLTRRFVAAPVRPERIVLEQRLYAVTFLLAVAAAAGVLAGAVWRVPAVGLATVAAVAPPLVVFLSAAAGAIFGMSDSRRANGAISSVFMMVVLVPGGAFFPAELLPGAVQAVARVVPTGIANLALTRALTGRAPEVATWPLWAWALGALALAVMLQRRRVA